MKALRIRLILGTGRLFSSVASSPDVLSTSDFYPFGQIMSGRSYKSDVYRYGFGGQEKTPELNPAHTTALYWEYDGRLGRRWNLDPVKKPWQSDYATFSDNPIWKIDPKGDDDFFDTSGNFLGHTDTEFNYIRVINADQTLSSAQENIPNNTKLVSQFDYNKDSNRDMLISIANYYSSNTIHKNIGLIDVDPTDAGASAYTNPRTKEISLVVIEGKINKSHNISDQLISSLIHEDVHTTQDLTKYNKSFEVPAIMAEVNSPTFGKTTTEFKQAMFSYATSSMNTALYRGQMTIESVENSIKMFNDSKLGEYGFMNYNKDNNQVEFSLMLPEVIVDPSNK